MTPAASGVRNVHRDVREGRWVVKIQRDGEVISAGRSFASVEEAAQEAEAIRAELPPPPTHADRRRRRPSKTHAASICLRGGNNTDVVQFWPDREQAVAATAGKCDPHCCLGAHSVVTFTNGRFTVEDVGLSADEVRRQMEAREAEKRQALDAARHESYLLREQRKKDAPVAERQTHCLRGHPFSEFASVVASTGFRRCRECARIRDIERNERVREAKRAQRAATEKPATGVSQSHANESSRVVGYVDTPPAIQLECVDLSANRRVTAARRERRAQKGKR